MATRIERGGNFPCSPLRGWYQGIDDRGFTHARLAHKNAEMALQIGQKDGRVASGAELHHGIAELPIEGKREGSNTGRFCQIAFIQCDQHGNTLVFSCDETAVYQFLAKAWNRRHNYDYLSDIRGNQLLPIGIATV
jgi:hypothetical protein